MGSGDEAPVILPVGSVIVVMWAVLGCTSDVMERICSYRLPSS